MKENLRFAWIATWFALVGQFVIFFVISLWTGEWRFLMWSFMASMMAGVPSLINTWNAQKKANLKKLIKTKQQNYLMAIKLNHHPLFTT